MDVLEDQNQKLVLEKMQYYIEWIYLNTYFVFNEYILERMFAIM